jgi:hypothetical protein
MKNATENKRQSFGKGPTLGFTDNFPNREMWKSIATELGGKFEIKHDSGYALESHHISIPHKVWEMKITVSDSQPLKFQISFRSPVDFNLTVNWKDFFDGIIKIIGKPGIKTGWDEFDRRYSVKSNRTDLVRRAFTTEIQKTFHRYDVFSLSYQTKTKSGTSNLVTIIQRNVGEREMIIELIEMHKLLINNFEKIKIIL